jgi:hypothetical protein
MARAPPTAHGVARGALPRPRPVGTARMVASGGRLEPVRALAARLGTIEHVAQVRACESSRRSCGSRPGVGSSRRCQRVASVRWVTTCRRAVAPPGRPDDRLDVEQGWMLCAESKAHHWRPLRRSGAGSAARAYVGSRSTGSTTPPAPHAGRPRHSPLLPAPRDRHADRCGRRCHPDCAAISDRRRSRRSDAFARPGERVHRAGGWRRSKHLDHACGRPTSSTRPTAW